MRESDYEIRSVVSAPFDQNAYFVWKRGRDEAILIDPGFDWRSLVRLVKREGLRPVAVVNTHGHADHIAGNQSVLDAFPGIPLITGRNEGPLLVDAGLNLSAGFHLPLTSPPATQLLDDGACLELGGLRFRIAEIGGHSPGGISLISDNCDPPFAIVGDVLFQGSVGRTDFPGGDPRALTDGIRAKLFCLPDATVIYSGHGPLTTIGAEKRTNPYVGLGTIGAGG